VHAVGHCSESSPLFSLGHFRAPVLDCTPLPRARMAAAAPSPATTHGPLTRIGSIHW
jgi:hypothetical protein